MRRIAAAALLAAVPLLAGWGDEPDYTERRALRLDGALIETLRIEAGAGSMTVTGEAGATEIAVDALIRMEGARGAEARALIVDNLRFSLERNGDRARLIADFRDSRHFRGDAAIDLEVSLPQGLALDIEDGSGAIVIRHTLGAVRLNDGSGSVDVSHVASVDIDDGSGSIVIADVFGGVHVDDGSGSIEVRRIDGSVAIEDGSGSIDVRDVSGNFAVNDGSGGVDFADIDGTVSIRD